MPQTKVTRPKISQLLYHTYSVIVCDSVILNFIFIQSKPWQYIYNKFSVMKWAIYQFKKEEEKLNRPDGFFSNTGFLSTLLYVYLYSVHIYVVKLKYIYAVLFQQQKSELNKDLFQANDHITIPTRL